jgi:hypothetical protein
LLVLVGCPKQTKRDEITPVDAGAFVADAALATPASPFATVLADRSVKLFRIAAGPALAIATEPDAAIYVLGANGSMTPLEPLHTKMADKQFANARIGGIAGIWPNELYVETGFLGAGANTRAITTDYLVDAARGSLREVSSASGHVSWTSPWSGGRTLAFRTEDARLDLDFILGGGGRFEALGGAVAADVPKVPSGARTNGEFVAYDSGRVFLVAGIAAKPGEEPAPPTRIWTFVSGAPPSVVDMKSHVTQLVRGRSETETLVLGGHFLRRFDGNAWVDVTTPDKDADSRISIGDDGSVWLASGRIGSFPGGIFRAHFPELHFERVPFPTDLTPTDILAKSDGDVWVTGVGSARDGGLAPLPLLHATTYR